MGIKGLTKFLSENAPGSVREYALDYYAGRKIAIDASTCLYQFLYAVRSNAENLTNAQGEVTSHLTGIFYRTLRLLDAGIKPVYVFDGKPPDIKAYELDKRGTRREDTQAEVEKARQDGNLERAELLERRLIKVTKQHNEDAQTLLKLMGIPYILAPTEAEAQCAVMAAGNHVYATATEDMDALTFGSTYLLRNLTASASKDLKIQQFCLNTALVELGISMDTFVDLCILMGCDYCETIPGIGMKRAIALLREHGSIENVLASLDPAKLGAFNPQTWPYKEARAFFRNPKVAAVPPAAIKWSLPDEQGLLDFMVTQNGFQEDRILKGIEKIKKALGKKQQGRIDAFFTRSPAPAPAALKRPLQTPNKDTNPSKRQPK